MRGRELEKRRSDTYQSTLSRPLNKALLALNCYYKISSCLLHTRICDRNHAVTMKALLFIIVCMLFACTTAQFTFKAPIFTIPTVDFSQANAAASKAKTAIDNVQNKVQEEIEDLLKPFCSSTKRETGPINHKNCVSWAVRIHAPPHSPASLHRLTPFVRACLCRSKKST